MDEKCQFLSLHASYLPIQVLKTSLVKHPYNCPNDHSNNRTNHRTNYCPNQRVAQSSIQTIIQTSGQTTAQTIVQKSCYLGRFSVNGSKLAPNCLCSFMILKVAKVFAPLWALFSLRMLANEHGIQQKIWLLIAAHMRGGL